MRVLFAALALIAVSTSNVVTAQSFEPTASASISYADLNLANPAGRQALEGRVKAASNKVCLDLKVSPIEEVVAVDECRTSMMKSAKRQLDLASYRSPRGAVLASR
jgi:UrcA family protein